ncbi:hypothetical protein BBK36DRAFT_1113703 [Trichoderma citrinoviride]|uniref:DUF7732 domain-containing protein n=1 Tax=Trichoderma citrinoviride TaxID=58853 RepID=A0A2T4BHE3_9HYPO|nr:hypothetical protein BBK36DRAFT_1113703 [Trichoderma citrinoviride]PTB68744.1 hypothetical protein BBK36DRAFT_1113703 [Trichoderma citrinoviride]
MRIDFALLVVTLMTTASASVIDGPRHVVRVDGVAQSEEHDLFKRKGGGGGGGRGGGGGGGSRGGGSSSGGGSSGGSSGGSRGGSSGSGGSSSNRVYSGNRAPSSNVGGTSAGGSGPKPSFGGGRYYAGGAATPYRAGGRSPSGILPFAILGGAALAFWPGVWLYGAYMYPYHNPYHYFNESSRRNETRDVLCGCGTYDVCGCDDNNNTAYYNSLIGNGSYDALNKSIVNVAEVNGTRTILINGSLPNGTTADGPDSSQDSSAASLRNIAELVGFWPAATAVLVAVFLA